MEAPEAETWLQSARIFRGKPEGLHEESDMGEEGYVSVEEEEGVDEGYAWL